MDVFTILPVGAGWGWITVHIGSQTCQVFVHRENIYASVLSFLLSALEPFVTTLHCCFSQNHAALYKGQPVEFVLAQEWHSNRVRAIDVTHPNGEAIVCGTVLFP